MARVPVDRRHRRTGPRHDESLLARSVDGTPHAEEGTVPGKLEGEGPEERRGNRGGGGRFGGLGGVQRIAGGDGAVRWTADCDQRLVGAVHMAPTHRRRRPPLLLRGSHLRPRRPPHHRSSLRQARSLRPDRFPSPQDRFHPRGASLRFHHPPLQGPGRHGRHQGVLPPAVPVRSHPDTPGPLEGLQGVHGGGEEGGHVDLEERRVGGQAQGVMC
mmetsp:Transcript_25269/g.51571  ORF Transcript_25269/g.51571 Transcript_25269/m.51571 type:complete len:215 (-) Transcript_25269:365-1009(-)